MNLYGQKPEEIKSQMMAEKTRRLGACKKRNAFFKEYDKLYYLQHYGRRSPGKIKGKKGIEAQANDATTQVNLMRQLIGVKDLRIKVFPRWITEAEMEAGSEIERWMWAVLEANNDRQEADVLDLVLFDAIRLGWGIAYTYWDQELAAESTMMAPPEMMPQGMMGQGMMGGMGQMGQMGPGMMGSPDMMGGGMMGGDMMGQGMMQPDMMSPDMMMMAQGGQGIPIITECPIVIQRVSPYCIYPESGGHQGRWRSFLVIEKEKNAMEVAQEWGKEPEALRKAKIGQKHTVTVDYTVYWGWERVPDLETGQENWSVVNCVMADDEIIREPIVMEGYDALPITLFFCHPTGDSRWEYMSLSSLFPIHLDIKLLDHLMSRLHKQVDLITNMPLFRPQGTGGQASPLKIDAGLMNIVDLGPGEKVPEYPKWPGNAPDFHILLSLERQKIEEGGISYMGATEAIPLSGISRSRLWETQLVKLVDPTKSYTRGLKSLFNKIRSLAVNFARDIPISLITNYPKASGNVIVTGGQLEPYALSPELAGELPMDQFRKLAIGLQFAQLPPQLRPFSMEFLMEKFLDIDQPEEEYAKLLLDMARQSKTVQLLETYQYLLSQGIDIDIGMVAQVEGMIGGGPQQQGQQGPGGTVSTALSPYEQGTSTLMEDQFQGEPPMQGGPGFLEGAAQVPGGMA